MGILDRLVRRRDHRQLASGTRADSWQSADVQPGGRWLNPMSGLGGPTDRAQFDQYVAGPPVDMWLADSLLETNAIARRIAGREAEDCTREGYDLTGMPPDLADALEEYCEGGTRGEGLGVLTVLAEARTWARAYGGGALVLLIDDGRTPDQPIDRTNIRAVRGVLSADRWELPVQQWGSDLREPRTYGRPRLYRLQLNRSGGGGAGQQVVTVHADRVIRLDGMALPRRRKLVRNGWGGSIFDLTIAPLRAYGTTHVQVAEAVTILNQGVLTSPALTDGLENEETAQVWKARLQAFAQSRSQYHETVVGQEETYQIHNRSLSGLGDAIKASVDALVAAADGMPRLVLLGEVTAGLSNSAEGELRYWYDGCAARQPKIYTPPVRQVVDLVMLSHEGPTQGRSFPYDLVWRPLWQESEQTQADLQLKQAQRRSFDLASMTVSQDEARRDPSLVETYGKLDQEPPTDPAIPGQEPPDDASLPGVEDEPVEDDGVVPLVSAGPSLKPLPSDLMDPQQAAVVTGLTTRRIRSMMRSNKLEYWSWGGADKVSMADLTALGQQHTLSEAEG